MMPEKKKKKIRTRQGDRYETYSIGTCENCNREGVKVRKVEAFDTFHKGSRGFYNICFSCIGPRVFWKKGGRTIESPTNIIRTPEGLEEFQRSEQKETMI